MRKSVAGKGVRELTEACSIFSEQESVGQALTRLRRERVPVGLVRTEGGWAAVSPALLAGIPGSRLLMDAELKVLPEISPAAPLDKALEDMERAGTEWLVVTGPRKPLGIIRRSKILEWLLGENRKLQEELRGLASLLESKVRERTRELQALFELSREMSHALDYEQLCFVLLEHLNRALQYDVAALLINMPEKKFLALGGPSAQDPLFRQWTVRRVLEDYESCAGERLCPEALTVKSFIPAHPLPPPASTDELAFKFSLPIVKDGKPVGLLFIGSKSEKHGSEERLRLCHTVAEQASIAFQRLEALVRTERTRLEAAVEGMGQGVVILDEEGRITILNKQARTMLPLFADVKIGEKLQRLGDVPLDVIIEKSSAGERQEILLDRPREAVYEVTAVPFFYQGEPHGTVITISDVTQERLIRRQLEQQERLAVVGQLAGGIAHDFNNILNVIIGFAELAQLKSADPLIKEYLDKVVEQGRRASSLIRQILDFSRRSIMEKTTLDLVPFIKEMAKILERTIPENIRIVVECEPGEYVIHGDPVRLQQVISNLATNARDAMPRGGSLKLRLDRAAPPGEGGRRPPEAAPGEYIRIQVADTGTGIPPDVLPHVFEPFFTTKGRGEGTGLGLAQVYGIVKQHDGYIDIESEVGKGTVVNIYLPALKERRSAAGGRSEEGTPRAKGATILLAEDEDLVRMVSRDMLESLGYRVLEAGDGEEALQVYREHRDRISLVLADMIMPRMGGEELAAALKAIDPGVKVLLISGYSLAESPAELERKGIIGYIQKPFSRNDIARRLKEVLG